MPADLYAKWRQLGKCRGGSEMTDGAETSKQTTNDEDGTDTNEEYRGRAVDYCPFCGSEVYHDAAPGNKVYSCPEHGEVIVTALDIEGGVQE